MSAAPDLFAMPSDPAPAPVPVSAASPSIIRAAVERERRALARLGQFGPDAERRTVAITRGKLGNAPELAERQAHDGRCHACGEPLDDTRPVVAVTTGRLSDRAAAFVSHATDRVQATPIQVHHAAVLAGDGMAVTIEGVCRGAGVTLLHFAPSSGEYRPRDTVALAGLRRLVDKRGAERATEILSALAAADLAPISGDHIRIGEALLCDPAYADSFDAERLTAAMRSLGAKAHAEARELAIAQRLPVWRALVAVIFRSQRGRKGTRRTDRADEAASARGAA